VESVPANVASRPTRCCDEIVGVGDEGGRPVIEATIVGDRADLAAGELEQRIAGKRHAPDQNADLRFRPASRARHVEFGGVKRARGRVADKTDRAEVAPMKSSKLAVARCPTRSERCSNSASRCRCWRSHR